MNAARSATTAKSATTTPAEDTTSATPTPTPVPTLTGYAANVQFLASRYKQGGRTVYSLDLSPVEIASLITPPDPSAPSPGNRAIRPAHADGFGKYIRTRDDWISPSLMLRSPNAFDFEVNQELAGIQFGVLSIARRNLADLHIVDGQHRILGIIRAERNIADDLEKARSALASARRVDPKGRAVADANDRIATLNKQRDRLENQRINVQIIVENDPTAYRQMFFDIADNALGITASVKTRFDFQKVVNRALPLAMDAPLLLGRVDPEGDRMGRGSPFIMGAKHVAEIIRSINVGLDGRVSRGQEDRLKEKDLANKAKDFFAMLIEAFPQMRALSLGQITADDLRKTSLLGSVLFVRILAGVYYELITERHWKRDDVEEFFAKLAPHVTAPVYEGDIWTTYAPTIFSPGANAPRSRRQDLKFLKELLVDWAIDKEPFVEEPPAPRPIVVSDREEDQPDYGSGYLDFGADVPTK